MADQSTLCAAAEAADPNHHLWRNGRLWWIAYTLHRGHLQERVRHSLQTDDVVIARARRDAIFAAIVRRHDCKLSLRFESRRPSRAS